MNYPSRRQSLVLAGTLGAMLAAVWPATAQQPAPAQQAAPLPPGSPLIGRPDTADAKRLAPVPAPPLAAAADKLPVDKLKAPKGLKVEVYASGMPNARSLALGDKGTVFVGSRLQDKVYAIIDKDGGKREVKIIASGLYRPNGVAFKNGTLYIMELSQLSKIDNIEDKLDNPPKPTVILDGLPKDEAHGWKYIAIGPDNKLYFEIGQPCNNCLPPEGYATMRRVNLDGTGMETIAQGIRNTVGFDWHPTSKELYFTDNSRDWMSEDLPNDELNRMTKVGQHFGSPFCYQGNLPDQEFGWGRKCEEFTPPIALLGPHTAALGMKFYTGNSFPAKYKNQILVARHGSWNKTNKLGGDVVLVNIKKDGSAGAIEPFLTGFLENNSYVGRPVDVMLMKDGSVLVSDDWNGAVWRVSAGGNARTATAR
jgi:glucose/arabinose dehydrogenase